MITLALFLAYMAGASSTCALLVLEFFPKEATAQFISLLLFLFTVAFTGVASLLIDKAVSTATLQKLKEYAKLRP